MKFKGKILLKGLRRRLSPKEVALFRLVVWCCLLVWMAFFAVHAVITSQILANWAPQVFPQTVFYQILAGTLPVWYLFTVGLIIFISARWAYRKLRLKPKVKVDKDGE